MTCTSPGCRLPMAVEEVTDGGCVFLRAHCPNGHDLFLNITQPGIPTPKRFARSPQVALAEQRCRVCGGPIEQQRLTDLCQACGQRLDVDHKAQLKREDSLVAAMTKRAKVKRCENCTKSQHGPCSRHGGPSQRQRRRLQRRAAVKAGR